MSRTDDRAAATPRKRRTKWTVRAGERLGIRQGTNIATLQSDVKTTLTIELEDGANVWRIPSDGIVKANGRA